MFGFPLPQMGFLGFALVNALIFLRGSWRKLGAIFAGFAVVLAWWLTLKPSNEANWQPDVAQLASAEINGDEVTLRNVRNCDYRTTADCTAHWDTHTVHISQITGIDMAINYWGSPWMAHPIVSFQFADAPAICFSIETRKKVGQTFPPSAASIGRFRRSSTSSPTSAMSSASARTTATKKSMLYRLTATARTGPRALPMKGVETKKELSPEQREELLRALKARFEKNMNRHKGLEWAKVQAKLEANPEKLWSLNEMERTGGEPDVVGHDKKTGEYIFYDCSAESPKGRRSVCYDREGLESRKEHKPENNAIDMAAAMGIELLTEEQYRELQKLGNFDTKTSSWVKTPSDIRKLGGALFCDRRYGHVFVYHNGAQSYYAARAFRGSLRVSRKRRARFLQPYPQRPTGLLEDPNTAALHMTTQASEACFRCRLVDASRRRSSGGCHRA